MIIVGLDLSLTHTGYCALNEKGEVLISGVLKSKPCGKTPTDEIHRITKISEDTIAFISNVLPAIEPDLVMIEGLAFMAKNTTALAQLSGLNYIIRATLVELKWPFCIIAPTSLKKFITGSGKGDKDMMMMKVFKEYGFEAMDNNENDAYAMAVCGLALLGKPLKKLSKPQQEVVKLLKTQL